MEYHLNKLQITVQESKENCLVIEFQGELDSYSLKNSRESVFKLVHDSSEEYVVFHFGNLKFINSESISFVLEIFDFLEKMQRKLVIVQAQPVVKDVLSVIGIFDTVPYYSNLLDFLKAKK